MIDVGQLKINKDNILSSLNFMKISDVIFSATLSMSDLEKFKIERYEVLKKENDLITFINTSFEIEENDIIFCHSDYLELFFKVFRNIDYKDIKLISSQSDRKINNNLYKKKPSCVSKWYSANVNCTKSNLIPIPLGIAPYRNTKSVIFEDLEKVNLSKDKKNKIFSNFNLNTNYFHRVSAFKQAHKNRDCDFKNFTNYDDYLNNLSQYKFSLAPWGNGIDTHRIWESLYLGVIPITKNHLHYRNLSNIPILLISSYEKLSQINFSINFDHIDYEKLTINWWKNIIDEKKETNKNKKIQLIIDNDDLDYFSKLIRKKYFVNNLLKKIITSLRRLDSKFNIFRKI